MFHLYFYLFFFFFPDRLTRVRWLCCELSWFLHRNFECPYVKFTVVCYNVVNVSLLCRECACNVVRLNIYHSFGFVDRKIDHRPNELEEFSCSLRKVVQWSCDGLFFFFLFTCVLIERFILCEMMCNVEVHLKVPTKKNDEIIK